MSFGYLNTLSLSSISNVAKEQNKSYKPRNCNPSRPLNLYIGQSVSFAMLEYPAGSINPPHTHPRFAELLFVVDGILEVGFIDTNNKLHTQKLQVGDMFVFPKVLMHYHCNADAYNPATAISAFGSANAGTVSVPVSVFSTGIDDGILAKAFKIDIATIRKIKAGLAAKA